MPIEENFLRWALFFFLFSKRSPPIGTSNLRIPKEVLIMTHEEKVRVRELRQLNMSYSNIARETGLSINTIKSFCSRNGMVISQKNECKCLSCGKTLRKSKYKPRKFCSDSCRNTWWNKRRYLRRNDKIEEYTCVVCGRKFYDYKSEGRKYCSQECYQKRGEIV